MPEPPTLSVPTRLKLAEVLLARQPGFALTDVSGAWVSMIQLSSRALDQCFPATSTASTANVCFIRQPEERL